MLSLLNSAENVKPDSVLLVGVHLQFTYSTEAAGLQSCRHVQVYMPFAMVAYDVWRMMWASIFALWFAAS